MKTRSLFIGMLLLLVLMGACNSGSVMTQATGFAYEVVVVMDQKDWKGPAGEAIKSELASSVPGLPQAEPSLKITYVQPKDFTGLLRYVRNILVVTIDPTAYTKVSVGYENNVWARGQVVVSLKAPNTESIVEYSKTHEKALVNFFVKVEMNRAIEQLQKEYSMVVMDNLKSDLNVMLNAPANFTYYKDTTDFFWSSNNANTETRAGVEYTPITLNGKYCGVMRGLWRMQGDMMGGPFVSHTRLDEKNHRVVVAEGFVYAPETDKRNFMRRIEAALFTLRLPGEFDEPVTETLDIPKEKK